MTVCQLVFYFFVKFVLLGVFALRHCRLELLFIFYFFILKRIELCNKMSFINEIAIANINQLLLVSRYK